MSILVPEFYCFFMFPHRIPRDLQRFRRPCLSEVFCPAKLPQIEKIPFILLLYGFLCTCNVHVLFADGLMQIYDIVFEDKKVINENCIKTGPAR